MLCVEPVSYTHLQRFDSIPRNRKSTNIDIRQGGWRKVEQENAIKSVMKITEYNYIRKTSKIQTTLLSIYFISCDKVIHLNSVSKNE